jgi:hypothetical protein
MNQATLAGLRLTLSGRSLFLLGLVSLLWLHTLRDSTAHAAILPLCSLLWIVRLSCVWGASNAAGKPVFRFLSFFAQVAVSMLMFVLFFFQLLRYSE